MPENLWDRQTVRDLLLPAVLGGCSLVVFTSRTDILFSFALIAPLIWRRSQPVPVFLVTTFLCLVQLATGQSLLLGDFAVPVVVYAVAAYESQKAWSIAALVTGLGGALVAFWRFYSFAYDDVDRLQALIPPAAGAFVVVAAFLLGRRDARQEERAAESEAERASLLANDRVQRAEMSASAERTRIARELHDIVAHSLSVVVVQADGGRAAAKENPEVAVAVLDTIAETARGALGDMRRLVGVLRSGADPEDDHPDYAPAPTVDDVGELVDQVRRAGLPVELITAGAPRPVPAGVGLAAYRLVQESLTNVIKHAGPAASAEVAVHYGPDVLQITVLDDGRGAAAVGDGNGNGLTGMRERVGLQGGTVAAQPRPGGGFLVTATMPAPAEPTAHQHRTDRIGEGK